VYFSRELSQTMPMQWSCPKCTFINDSRLLQCEVCETPSVGGTGGEGGEGGGGTGGEGGEGGGGGGDTDLDEAMEHAHGEGADDDDDEVIGGQPSIDLDDASTHTYLDEDAKKFMHWAKAEIFKFNSIPADIADKIAGSHYQYLWDLRDPTNITHGELNKGTLYHANTAPADELGEAIAEMCSLTYSSGKSQLRVDGATSLHHDGGWVCPNSSRHGVWRGLASINTAMGFLVNGRMIGWTTKPNRLEIRMLPCDMLVKYKHRASSSIRGEPGMSLVMTFC
jgi:hypothetical protein